MVPPDEAIVNSSTPLDNFPVIRSRNIEEICEAIGRFYARPLLPTAPGGTEVDATINNCRLQDIALSYACYGAPLTLEYPSTSLFVQLFPVRGMGAIHRGATSGTLRPGLGTLILPGVPYTMKYGTEYAHLVLRLDEPALTRKLAAMTGTDIHEPLRIRAEQDSGIPRRTCCSNIFRFWSKLSAKPSRRTRIGGCCRPSNCC